MRLGPDAMQELYLPGLGGRQKKVAKAHYGLANHYSIIKLIVLQYHVFNINFILERYSNY